jgi:hypothetical protein
MTVIVVILSTFPSFVQFVTKRIHGKILHCLQLLSSDYFALLAFPVGQFQNLCLQRFSAIALAFEFLSRAQLVIKQVYASFRQFLFKLIFVLIKLRA